MDAPSISGDVKARHDKMVGLVETMLKLHRDLPKAKTPHETEMPSPKNDGDSYFAPCSEAT